MTQNKPVPSIHELNSKITVQPVDPKIDFNLYLRSSEILYKQVSNKYDNINYKTHLMQ
jgi:hypothetical protein